MHGSRTTGILETYSSSHKMKKKYINIILGYYETEVDQRYTKDVIGN